MLKFKKLFRKMLKPDFNCYWFINSRKFVTVGKIAEKAVCRSVFVGVYF